MKSRKCEIRDSFEGLLAVLRKSETICNSLADERTLHDVVNPI